MASRSKLVLAGLTATLLMAFAVSSGGANRLSLSNHNFRMVFTELRFFGEGGGSEATVACPLTLEGSFHSNTIRKVIGALIGHVSRASCGNASLIVLQETLPWYVTYEGFSGALPRITRLRLLLRRAAIQVYIINGFGTTCLYGENGTIGNFAGELILEAGGNASTFLTDNSIRLPLIRRGGLDGFCPPEVGFEGSGTVTLLGNTTRIRITLI